MKKISKMLSLITGICVISMSCERDTITELNSVLELTVPIDPRVKQLSDSDNHRLISTKDPYEREDVLLEKFSKSLSKSLKEKNFRDFIKSEANKQFDGDYDILVLNHLSELIDGKKLSDAIVSSGVITHDELTELTKIKKDLNIAIPANIEKWNTTNQAPVVTYIPTSYKENKTETVLGFDFNEKKYSIDAINEPDVPVIVVGRNERVDENNNVRKGFLEDYNNNAKYNMMKNSATARVMSCVSPYRTNGVWERLDKIHMKVSTYEGWLSGKAEVRLKCFAPNLSTPSSFANIIRETSDINIYRNQSEEWVSRPLELFQWNNSILSESVLFFFYESDGGPYSQTYSQSYAFQIPGGGTNTSTVQYSIQRDDQVIGRIMIPQFSCPPSVRDGIYHYGVSTDFRFSQQSF